LNGLSIRPTSTRRALLATGLALAAAAVACLPLSAGTGGELLHIVVLHTNDIHGQAQPRPATWVDREVPPLVGGLPRVAAYVKRVRREAGETGAGVLVVDGGDWFQGTPEGFVDDGRIFVNAYSKVGYDAVVVGNHELDLGISALQEMIETYSVPALVANVFQSEGGDRVPWADPYRVIEVAGLRVGVVGLLTTTTPSITHPEASALYFEDPATALAEVSAELEGRVDWILPVTHLGVPSDRRLAKAHPALDVIVGGHSHTYLKQGVEQGETFIVQAGSKASAVGQLDLWFDEQTKELVKREYKLVTLFAEPEDDDRNGAVDKICTALVARSEREMAEPVGVLLEPLKRAFRRVHSSPAGNFITDTMRAALEADVAIQNRGGIRCDLPKGEVTRRGLFELLPFGNHLVLLELSGEDLFACVRASVEGTAHTGLEVSGATIVYEMREGQPFLVDLEVGGEHLDRKRTYRLCTNNFLAGGGDGYEVLKDQRVLREAPTFLRDVLERRFRSEGEIELPHDERYREARP
jgi:5'-nucleotidase/UDP-sugar diphosphatase